MAEQFPQQLPNVDPSVQEQAPRPFEDFTPAARAGAILAGMKSPASKELILHYAGVDPEELPDDQKEAVADVFAAPYVQHSTHEKFGEQYQILPDDQETALKRAGVVRQMVNRHILGHMLKDLDLDLGIK